MLRRMSAQISGGVRARARGLSRQSGHSTARPWIAVWIMVGMTYVPSSTRPWSTSGAMAGPRPAPSDRCSMPSCPVRMRMSRSSRFPTCPVMRTPAASASSRMAPSWASVNPVCTLMMPAPCAIAVRAAPRASSTVRTLTVCERRWCRATCPSDQLVIHPMLATTRGPGSSPLSMRSVMCPRASGCPARSTAVVTPLMRSCRVEMAMISA